MFKRASLVLSLATLIATTAWAQEGPTKGGTDAAAVAAVLQSYVAAFNKNDAKAMATHWAPQGVYVDQQTGERTSGREALLADFQKTFKDHPGARLSAEATETRLIKPDVASVAGRTTLLLPGEDPDPSAFTALLVKQGDKWVLDSVQESPLATPPSAHEALKELSWLVGHWVDKSDTVKVDTTVRWGTASTFLVRSFVVTRADDDPQQGTQVIGWDSREKQIRSWVFYSDGSFGEGVWSKSGDDWLVRSTQTLEDGRIASGTQVIKRVDDDTMTVQIIGQDVEGEPVPSSEPVQVVRAPATAATSSTQK